MELTSADLKEYIAVHKIDAQIVHLAQETLTVETAATAVGVTPQQIIKSVLFLADGEPLLVITNGVARIHRKRLADVLGMSRKRVKMANAAQVLAITGYRVGAVPPFGHLTRLPALLDEGVLAETAVFGGGGAVNALMRITPAELQRVTAGRVVNVADRETE